IMSKVPPDHLVHLRRRPFAFGCATSVFPPDEMEALSEYGNWLEALAGGGIRPVTADQKHFLRGDRGEAGPKTVCERGWGRLEGRAGDEREGERAPPPAPPPGYGGGG